MKKSISMSSAVLVGALCAYSNPGLSDEYVGGYVRKDGTYVEPYLRSSPNSLKFDNYSSQGNINPYTGSAGSQRNEFSGFYIPPSPRYEIDSRPIYIAPPQ